jgi:hypothetical protein
MVYHSFMCMVIIIGGTPTRAVPVAIKGQTTPSSDSKSNNNPNDDSFDFDLDFDVIHILLHTTPPLLDKSSIDCWMMIDRRHSWIFIEG